MNAGYTTHRVVPPYLYNDSLRKLIPFPRTMIWERWFFSKDGHQWNHSETTAKHGPSKNMNMQHNEHDTRSNSQWKKYKMGTMQIHPITMHRNGTWYWVLNNHEPHNYAHCMHCTHSLQLADWWTLCTNVYVRIIHVHTCTCMYTVHVHCTLEIQFQNFVSTILVYRIGGITLYLSTSTCSHNYLKMMKYGSIVNTFNEATRKGSAGRELAPFWDQYSLRILGPSARCTKIQLFFFHICNFCSATIRTLKLGDRVLLSKQKTLP